MRASSNVLIGSFLVAASLLGVGASPAKATESAADVQVETDAVITADAATLNGPVGSFEVNPGEDGGSRTTMVEEQEEGSVTAETVVPEGQDADYELDFTRDSVAEIVSNDDGVKSVLLTTREGELLGGLVVAGATDSTGRQIETVLSLEGSTVSQSVAVTEKNVAYPVQMSVNAGTVWYRAAWVSRASKGYIVNADPTQLGRTQIAWNVHYIHVGHVKTLLGTAMSATYWNWNIEQQFVCHVVGAYFPSGVYNMESWQPALSWGEIANPWDRCNRIK